MGPSEKAVKKRPVHWVVCGHAPTRALFLELAEKLRVIVSHRLRVGGYYTGHDDCDSEDEWTDAESMDEDENEDDVGKIEGYGHEMEGECRKLKQIVDSYIPNSPSESGSECPDLPCQEPSLEEEPDRDFEWEATCAINGTVVEAEQCAHQIHYLDHRGLNMVFFNQEKMSAMAAWVKSARTFRKWMKVLHKGCEERLDYNPLLTAVYELNLDWNIQRVRHYHPKDVAEMVKRLQEQAAERKMRRALVTTCTAVFKRKA